MCPVRQFSMSTAGLPFCYEVIGGPWSHVSALDLLRCPALWRYTLRIHRMLRRRNISRGSASYCTCLRFQSMLSDVRYGRQNLLTWRACRRYTPPLSSPVVEQTFDWRASDIEPRHFLGRKTWPCSNMSLFLLWMMSSPDRLCA